MTPGFCNSAMPNDSTFNRFLWFVNFLARNGVCTPAARLRLRGHNIQICSPCCMDVSTCTAPAQHQTGRHLSLQVGTC